MGKKIQKKTYGFSIQNQRLYYYLKDRSSFFDVKNESGREKLDIDSYQTLFLDLWESDENGKAQLILEKFIETKFVNGDRLFVQTYWDLYNSKEEFVEILQKLAKKK